MKIVILFCLLPAVLGNNLSNITQGFDAFDVDGDGIVGRNDVEHFFNRIDNNGDGFITFKEYSAGVPQRTPPEKLQALFNFYDSLDGLSDRKISGNVVLVILKRMDIDNDDEVSITEFDLSMNRINPDVATDVIATIKKKGRKPMS